MSELHSWARSLGGEVSGGQVLCPGPGHSAADRSLSVTIGKDGEPIVNSFSGDDWKVCRDHVRSKIGLEPFKPNGHASYRHAKPPRKQYFDYCDHDGVVLYQVVREDLRGDKKISQRVPDGNGGWNSAPGCMNGVQRVPYRLPDLLEALAHGRMVVIAEGERKVDLLWSWNVPATCNSGGAGKWKAQYSAYFRGSDVVILPDNDEPGRLHAEAVAASLKGGGAIVRVLNLPGLGPKGDVIDWAAKGGTVEQLHELIENGARASNGQDKSEAPGNGKSAPKQFELIPFDEVRIDTVPAYRIKGVFPRIGLCIVWGPPKCGKSFLVFDMSMHVALGWEYRGKKVRQGSVVYCALEGCAAFKNRIEAFRQVHLSKHIKPVPFHLMATPMTLVADHPALIESIRLKDASPAIVVIDTLNRSLAGSESSDEDMSAYVKAADAVRDTFNCLVVIVHHCGHEGTRPRGHSSLIGALDAQIAVKRDEADNVTGLVELMKDGPQGDEWVSRLAIVDVGTDNEGDEITSCVIEPVEWAKPRKRVKPLSPSAATALKAFHEILYDAGITPPLDPYIPPNTKAVTIAEWRAHAVKRGLCASEDSDSQGQAFRRVFKELLAANKIAVSDPFAWALYGGNGAG